MIRKTPRPGSPARGTKSGRPIMVLLDLLGRRWALRILWELRERRCLNFRALQAASGTSPNVLNTRLAELRAAGIVEHDDAGYRLTRSGEDLLGNLLPLHTWAERWAQSRAKKG